MLKMRFIVFFVFLLGSIGSYSKSSFSILSSKDDTRFIWNLSGVPSSTRAVVIKAKNKKGEWVDFSSENILLGQHRNYKQVSNSLVWQQRIEGYDKNNSEATELLPANIGKLINDVTKSKELSFAVMLNYKNALVLGCGYVFEGKLSKKQKEFGLFLVDDKGDVSSKPYLVSSPKGVDELVPKSAQLNFQFRRFDKSLKLNWNCSKADYNKYKMSRGVHFKKSFEGKESTLNNEIILPGRIGDLYSCYEKDKPSLDTTKNTLYEVVLETVFDVNVSVLSQQFKPNNYPLKPVKVNFKESKSSQQGAVNLSWELENGKDERFISHFLLFRSLTPRGGFSQIVMLDSLTSYQDKDVLEKINYYYKVTAVLKGEMGFEADYSGAVYVRPRKYAVVPQNFKHDVIVNEKGSNVVFSWTSIASQNIGGYYLYFYSEDFKKFLKNSDKIEGNTYTMAIDRLQSQKVQYRLSSIDINDYESELSDTITVITPSTYLPAPNFAWKKDQEKRTMTLTWAYSKDYLDIKGFRMYLNGEVFGDENKIDGTMRSFTEGQMSRGYYKVQFQAVSIYGVESELTTVQTVKFR